MAVGIRRIAEVEQAGRNCMHSLLELYFSAADFVIIGRSGHPSFTARIKLQSFFIESHNEES